MRPAMEREERARFVGKVLIVLTLTSLAFIAWKVRSLLLLAFAAALVALVFRVLAAPFRQRLGLSDGVSVTIAVLLVVGLVALAGSLFGAQISSEAKQLTQSLPRTVQYLEQQLGQPGLAEQVRSAVTGPGGSNLLSSIGSYATTFFGGLADFLLVLVAGIFLAAQPRMYREGMLKLVPEQRRPNIAAAMDVAGTALRQWLKGSAVAMVAVALMTGVGLWLLGVPSPVALALLAGLLDFVPWVGPVLAAIPGILFALTQGPQTALWTAGLYLLVQQIEGNILRPLVQQRTVKIPPALLLFGLAFAGMLFGVAGVLLAAPLTVLLFVFVKKLYVRDTLGTPTDLPETAR